MEEGERGRGTLFEACYPYLYLPVPCPVPALGARSLDALRHVDQGQGERGRKRGKGEGHTVESLFSLPVSPSSMPCACTRDKVFRRAPPC